MKKAFLPFLCLFALLFAFGGQLNAQVGQVAFIEGSTAGRAAVQQERGALLLALLDVLLHRGELWGSHACYRTYECGDGRRIAIGALEPRFWQSVCEGLGFPQHVPGQWSRRKQPAMFKDFERKFRTKPLSAWMKTLGPLDACVTPVQTLAEVVSDAQVLSRDAFLPQRTARGTFLSPTFLPQITKRSHRKRAPRHGEHTRDVLRSLGMSKARIESLRDTGVIQ